MFFRNLTLFRFNPAGNESLFDAPERSERARFEILEPRAAQGLRDCALKPVGPLELSSRGFISPFGRDSEALSHRIDDCIWLTVGGEDKLLPAAVVNAELTKRIAAMERTEGRKPGGRARKRQRDDVIAELLPRALVRPSRIDCYLDLRRGVLAVDTSSRKAAESVVSEIRRALGSFPALPLNAEVAPRAVLTAWLDDDSLPDGLAHADSAILKDAADRGASVRLTHQQLASAEVAQHLAAGKQCTRLGLTFCDHLGFTVDEDLALRGVRFLDGVIDQLESMERDDVRAELDARFALMTGTLGRLFDTLFPALHVSAAEG